VLNVGTPEMLVILVVALLVLGPNKLPEVARQVGKAMGEIRRLGAGFQAEMRDAMQEPVKMEPVDPDPEPEPEPEGVAPGWSPEAVEAGGSEPEATAPLPPVEDEPPGGAAPV
jgi:Tat protein translocase TatB subunit